MTKTILALTVSLGLLVSSSYTQASSKPFSFYIGSGLSMPLNPDAIKDSTTIGFHGNAQVGYRYSPSTEFLLNIDYHLLGSDNNNADGGDWQIIQIGADAKLNLSLPESKMYPYFFGGFGLAEVKKTERTFRNFTSPSVSVTKLYYEFGGGITMNMFFVKAKYVKVLTEDGALILVPMTVGIQF